jgi:hypothetical protein
MVLYTHLILLLYRHLSLAAERPLYTHMLFSGCREAKVKQKKSGRLRRDHKTGCGAASSAPRSGRGGRRCEPCHPDHEGAWCNSSTAASKTVWCPCKSGGPCQRNLTNPTLQHVPDRPSRGGHRPGQLRPCRLRPSHRGAASRYSSCPGPSPSNDRIAQQRERRRAKPEARGASPRAVAISP